MVIALPIKYIFIIGKHFLFTLLYIISITINSNDAFSQDMPTYEEAPTSYPRDLTSNFSKTYSNYTKPPTHQPLNQESIDTSSLYQLSEKERNAMLEKIKVYKSEGKMELIRKEMLKLLKNHSFPTSNPELSSVTDEPSPPSDLPLSNESDLTENQDTVTPKDPTPEEGKVLDDPTKVTTNTLDSFVDESLLSTLSKEVTTTLNDSPELLKKIESDPSILKDPSFIKYVEEIYWTQQKQ